LLDHEPARVAGPALGSYVANGDDVRPPPDGSRTAALRIADQRSSPVALTLKPTIALPARRPSRAGWHRRGQGSIFAKIQLADDVAWCGGISTSTQSPTAAPPRHYKQQPGRGEYRDPCRYC
jgi:hypothetical protein